MGVTITIKESTKYGDAEIVVTEHTAFDAVQSAKDTVDGLNGKEIEKPGPRINSINVSSSADVKMPPPDSTAKAKK